MKNLGKKILSLFLSIAMVVALVPTDVYAEDAVAKIGETQYQTLKDAINACPENASGATTITLLGDVTNGASFGFADTQKGSGRNVVIDLNNHTYTFTTPAMGSTGTESQSMHLASGNTLTVKNGTLKVSENNTTIKRLIQNYADLTLENVVVDTTNESATLNGGYDNSFCAGTITLKGSTTFKTSSNTVNAFDIDGSYGSGATTVKLVIAEGFTGSIGGKVEYYKSTTSSLEDNANYFVAETDKDNTTTYLFGSLQNAFDAATSNSTVTLLKNITGRVTIPSSFVGTLDLNNKNITSTDDYGIVNNGNLTITGSGTVNAKYAIRPANVSTTVINGGTYESVEGAMTITSANNTVTINSGTFSASDNAVLAVNGSSGYNNNKIIINGGTFNGNIATNGYIACGIYAANGDTWTVNGGTFNITNGIGVLARAGQVNINGGTFNITNSGTVSGYVGDKKTSINGGVAYFDSAANYPAYNSSTDKIEITGGTYSIKPESYLADGYESILNGDGSYTVSKKVETEILDSSTGESVNVPVAVTTVTQDKKVDTTNLPTDVASDVKDKMAKSTVSGAQLSKTSDAAYKSVLSQAYNKTSDNIKSLVSSASEIDVKITVAIKPTAYSSSSTTYNLTPTATVTVKTANSGEKSVSGIEVTNDMLNTDEKISVSIYTGFKPVKLIHKDDNGNVIETFNEDDFTYDESTGLVTFKISHFSDIIANSTAQVAKIGTTYYSSLNDALSAAESASESGQTVQLLVDLDLNVQTVTLNNDVILDLAGNNLTCKYLVAFGDAHVIDSATSVKTNDIGKFGQLKVTSKTNYAVSTTVLQDRYYPIYANNGYYFIQGSLMYDSQIDNTTNSIKIGFGFKPVTTDTTVWKLIEKDDDFNFGFELAQNNSEISIPYVASSTGKTNYISHVEAGEDYSLYVTLTNTDQAIGYKYRLRGITTKGTRYSSWISSN